MRRFALRTVIALLVGVGMALGLLCLLDGHSAPVIAGFEPNRVGRPERGALRTSGSVITVCLEGGCDFDTVQDAVDAANDGDEIRVAAGTYTGVSARAGLIQMVYISKTVTIRGGYTTTDWTESNPVGTPTVLDARRQGRVFYITGSGRAISPTIEGLCITGGNAAGLGGGRSDEHVGGGVYVDAAAATISGCQVLSNVAELGGGLYVVDSPAVLMGNEIAGNKARAVSIKTLGGGVYLWRSGATLEANTVRSNSADQGGGLYLRRSGASITGNHVTVNAALDRGGGLYLYLDSDATLEGNSVTANTAEVGGGGLFVSDSAPLLIGNRFSANAAEWGGGVYLYKSDGEARGNIVTANIAVVGGGGLCLDQSDASLRGNAITDNTAKHGGGLQLAYSSEATLAGNTVIANRADLEGGGLYLLRTDATLTNMVVADNRASAKGSGIHIWGGSMQLLHSTLARNDSIGIYVYGDGSVALANNILVGHQVGLYVDSDVTASLENTLWGSGDWANDTDWTGPGTIVHHHDYDGDPAFVDPDAGDYHIGPGSAAIDRGVDVGVSDDIDGHPRPISAEPDLGADEYTGIDLSTSTQTASLVQAGAGELVTYTIVLRNNGLWSAPQTLLFDAIPTQTTYLLGSAHATGGTLSDAGSINWTGALIPNQPVTVTFCVTVEEEVFIENTAVITDRYGDVTTLTAWVNALSFYFPLILR